MNRAVLITAAAFVLLLAGSTAASAQATRGFAAYGVTFSSPNGTRSVTINETVGPSAKAGYQDVILQFIGGAQNLTYSRAVNSSANLFPFLPSVANQSLDYTNGTAYKVHVSVVVSGSASVTFQGSRYTLSVMKVWGSVTFGNRTVAANGTVETFPSTLVYSASVGNSTDRLQALLMATDLPLNSPSSQMATAAAVGAGVGLGAVALGGALLLRRREKRVDKKEEKPLHWVD